jgi:iron complex transport system ATP-binding protein
LAVERRDELGESTRVRGSCAPPAIRARGAGYSYGRGGFALAGVDLDLEPGSFTVILGPNGSGKSTLVRLLGGLVAPHAGSVTLGDRPAAARTPRERGRLVAFVTQDEPRQMPFSAFEIVMMGRFPYQGVWPFDSTQDIETARAAMSRMEVDRFADRLLADLSSGERQRVYLARALAQQPLVLLLDEPAANLDLAHQVELYRFLAQLNAESGITIAAVSHELTVATEHAGQIVLLKAGRVQHVGAPADVLTEAALSAVFDVRVRTLVDPATGQRVFAPRA